MVEKGQLIFRFIRHLERGRIQTRMARRPQEAPSDSGRPEDSGVKSAGKVRMSQFPYRSILSEALIVPKESHTPSVGVPVTGVVSDKLIECTDLKSGDTITLREEVSQEREAWLEKNLYIIESCKVPPGEVITFCGYRPGPGKEPFPMRLFRYGTFTGYLSAKPERRQIESLPDPGGDSPNEF